MDDFIIKEFVNLKHSGGYSSVDLIRKLNQRYPAQIKIIPLRIENNSSFFPFSTMVKLGNDKQFVENDRTQKLATSKACTVACGWLMEAGKKYPPRQMNKGYSQNNIKKRSRASSVALLPFAPQKFPQDEKLNEIIASLKALGHDVKIQNDCFEDINTYETVYYSSFFVEDIGEFNGQSTKSKLDANLIAAEKLKHYWSNFAKSDKLQTKESFNDNNGFNLNGGIGRCDSETDFASTECSLSRVDTISTNNEPRLSPCDLKWIQLLNNFNSVYDPKKSSISIIEMVISMDPVSFKITSNFNFTRNIYSTIVKNENLGTFTGEDKSQPNSRITALTSLFEQLRKLSGLFSSFKTVYPSGIDSCLSEMNVFLSMNRELITVQVWPKSRLLYQACIILSELKHFKAVANNKEEARRDAYIQMVEYMQLYCEHIKQTDFVSNHDRFSSHPYGRSKRGGAFSGNRQGYTYQRPPGPKVPQLPSSMCNKLTDLITSFTKIYDYRIAPEITMDKLMATDKSMFEKTRIKTRDRKGDAQYETKIKFSSAIFTGVAPSKTLSNDKAMIAVHNRLLRMSELFSYFRKEYYPKIPVNDFKIQIFIHHEEVLKLKTRKRGIGFQTIISLVHFCDFHGESENEEDAEELAFKKLIEYMLVLITRIPKTKEELEKEQKQIAILNPNVANILENSSEFSFNGLNGSKGARNSNEVVNRTSEMPVYNSKVDDKLSKLVKLVKNFNQVTLGTDPQNAIQKLNEMNPPNDSFVKLTTDIYPKLSITIVDFIGIGSFFSSEDSKQKSEREASRKAIEFIENLKLLLAVFEKTYKNPLYSSLDIIENLVNDVIKWSTTIVRDNESISPRYHSILQLVNMCSFDRTAENEMDAKKAVAEEGVNFLYKLSQAIHSN